MSLRASLVISGDASGAEAALASADKAMDRTEAGAEQLAASYAKADAAIGALGREHASAAGAVKKAGAAFDGAANDNAKSAGLAAHHIQNLSFQATDLAVQLASGANPMMAFAQQGGQVAGIMQQAGVGVGGLVKQLGGMAIAFLAANPLLLAAAAAAGVLAIGVGLVTAEINKTSAVTVTWQDVMLGAFDVLKEAVSSRVTAAFEAMGIDVGAVWKTAVSVTRTAINIMIGAALAVPKLIGATYDKIGPAIGDAFYSGVNLAIGGLNALLAKAADGVNKVVGLFNAAFGTSIPNVVAASIPLIANPYAGGMGKLGSAGAQALVGSFTKDYVGSAAAALSDAAQNRARLREAAENAGRKAGAAGGKAGGAAAGKAYVDEFAKTVEALTKGANDNLAQAMVDNAKAVNAEIDRITESGWDTMMADIAEKGKVAVDNANAEAEARMRINEELAKSVDYLDRMLGLDGSLNAMLGSIRDAFPDLFDELGKVFGGLKQGLDDILGQLGSSLGQLGAGIKFGGAADSVMDAVGIKSSKAGAQLGGAIGQFAGPIGMIAGSMLGGIVGGMMKSTPRASATVSIIAGEAMETAVRGSSAKLKAMAGEMASGLIAGLSGIADQLGAQLTGDAAVSVGMRKGNYRVDPTGQGITKTSKGAVDFGEDKAAAVAYALQVAIQQGVLGGLSASLKNLIESDGDLETQLGKALSLKGAFDDLAERTDPLGFKMGELAKEQARLTAILDEAKASSAEYAQIEQLFALKRADLAKDAANDNGSAELIRQRREMEIEMLRAQGKATEALTAARALELEGLDASLRPMREAINAALDAADAQAQLAATQAAAAETAARLAASRRDLEIQLAEALGDTAGAAAMRQADALAAIDPSLRALQQSVWDAQAAAEVAASAERALAESRAAADQAARALADAEARTAAARRDLQIQLAEALGDAAGAAAMRQADALAALDPVLRDLQQSVWDASAAAEVAASAERALAEERRAGEEAARAAAEAEARIAATRRDLEIQLQDALGNGAAAEAMRRADTLAALDPSLRELQQSIFNAKDAAALTAEAEKVLAAERAAAEEAARAAAEAEAARAKALEDARGVLAAAYQRESGALQTTINKFRNFGQSLREFRDGLFASASPAAGYDAARRAFTATSALASAGNEKGLSAFSADANAFLKAANDNASTIEEYQRAVAMVAAGANSAIGGAAGIEGTAAGQLAAMEKQVGQLIDLNERTVSVAEGIARLEALQREGLIPAVTDTLAPAIESLAASSTGVTDAIASLKDADKANASALVNALLDLLSLHRSWDGGGAITVTADADAPVITQVAA